uniref:Uncharacterized protein n=1 Tax=Mycena chlorophos TaxID=658473 RepID=A0ABQ0KWB1_MYCCL|nr:predicted protein [Mycena chlorophos]
MQTSSESQVAANNQCNEQQALPVDATEQQAQAPPVDASEHERDIALKFQQSQVRELLDYIACVRTTHEEEMASVRRELDAVKQINDSSRVALDAQAEKLAELRQVIRTNTDAHDAEVRRLQGQAQAFHSKYATLISAVGGSRIALVSTRAKIVGVMEPLQDLLKQVKWIDRVDGELADTWSHSTNANAGGNDQSSSAT